MNVWERRARGKKAYRMFRVLVRLAALDSSIADVPTLRAASAQVREQVAGLANVRTPSDASWQAAVDLFERREDRHGRA